MSKGLSSEMWKRSMCVLLVVILLGFGTCIGSMSNIMLIKADEYRALAEDQQLRDTVTPAKRGTIYDTNMNVLAASATAWQVYIIPTNFKNNKQRRDVAFGLSRLLKMDYKDVLERCKRKTGNENIGDPIELKTSKKVRKFINNNEYNAIIGISETTKRYYPNDNLASTVIGFVGSDNQGLEGLENKYDTELTGTPGRVVSARNASGADMPFSYEKVVDAKDGNSLVLTVDEYIQHIVEKYLTEAVEENNVQNRGCVIAMDVKTGGILAMATEPDYNLNDPFTIYDKEKAKEINELTGDERIKALNEARQEQWRNKAVSDVYEPGSVFKIITGSAAIEENATSLGSSFYCPGYIQIANRRISCHKHEGHGKQDLMQAFQNSCNPAFIGIGQTLGLKKFTDYRKSFGLEGLTGIDLPGESEPIFHSYSSMGSVELASESFGQTFKITPVQLITAVSAAVNGGYLYKPHVVKQILDNNGNIIENKETEAKRQVISEETSKIISQCLESVVSIGTGKNAYVAGYRIGGKTGTSEKIDLQDESGETTKYIASFCGVAPMDDPSIAILMLLDEPNVVNAYGGTLCAPMVGKMFSEILPYLGVSAEYTAEEAEELDVSTPDVSGYTVDKAKETITEMGLNARVIGEGDTVLRQVPSAAQTLPKGGTVVLYTEEGGETKTAIVPDFTGMTVSQANAAGAAAGLNVCISGSADNSVAYAQSKEYGKEVEIGSVVTVEFRSNVTVQ